MAHSVDNFESRELPNTEGAQSPFFSPDGQWVGFFSGNAMRRVPLSGGAVQTITQVPTVFGSADWLSDERILTTSWTMGLGVLEVPAAGGDLRELVSASVKPSDMVDLGFLNPQSIGDSGRVLFQSTAPGAPVGLYDPERNEARFLRVGMELGARYVSTGHLLWVADGSLFAAAIDLDAFELTSTPVAVVVNVGGGRVSAFDISESGTLAYVAGAPGSANVRMISVDRAGAVTVLSEGSSGVVRPVVSPDGRSVLVADQVREGYELFAYDIVRGGRRSVAVSPLGVWTPDGVQVVYVAPPESSVRFARRAVDGSGPAESLGGEPTDNWWPTGVSPDGRWLAFYNISAETSRDILIMDLEDPEHSVQTVIATLANERSAVFSPDGRWLAYVSDESGRDEVYVRPAPPATGGAFPLSTAGGREPVWARDGSEIFYRRGDQMVSLPLTVGGELVPGEETVLFTGNFAAETGGRNQFYGVTPDAQHFIMVESGADSNHVNVVMNWFEELEKLVPTDSSR
jgi:serine/threonine-protein kinase